VAARQVRGREGSEMMISGKKASTAIVVGEKRNERALAVK